MMRSHLTLTLAFCSLLACKGGVDGADTAIGAVDADGDGFTDDVDCDDLDVARFPGAEERCGGVDDDCDGAVDEGAVDAVTWYTDSDGDGYGDNALTRAACQATDGEAERGGDCNDESAEVNPGASEDCADPRDLDCDGLTGFVDEDGDGSAACEDCDDLDSAVFPGQSEVCNGVDDDCDGLLDDADDSAIDLELRYVDADGDGYGDPSSGVGSCPGASGVVETGDDCDDDDAQVHPGSHHLEVPRDGVDTDCDGNDDCDDLSCDGRPDIVLPSSFWNVFPTQPSQVYWADAQGFSSSTSLQAGGVNEVLAEDFNDDGYVDLLMVNTYEGGFDTESRVYFGGADGLSEDRSERLGATRPTSACAGDFDADGLLDVVLATHDDGSGSAGPSQLFYNSATGFGDGVDLHPLQAYDCVVDDLNLDGHLDIVFAVQASGSAAASVEHPVYWGSSSGFSESNRTLLAGHSSLNVYVADLDDDGHLDVLLPSYNDGDFDTNSYIYWGSASGYTATDRSSLPSTGATAAAIGDVDADGALDVVLAGAYDGNQREGLFNNVYYQGQGGFTVADRSILTAQGTSQVSLRDLDGDGYLELITSNFRTNSTTEVDSYVFWGGASGFDDTDRTELPTVGSMAHMVEDLDGDGLVDLLFGGVYDSAGNPWVDSSIYYGGSELGVRSDSLAGTSVLKPLVVGAH